ncbi:hypothetical protein CDAR_15521 [Caerostris darwini]|uniref:Transmembrane protein n=1 Tax=Caerostris darwini TaxID=1538125 RepID=A0AAV4S7K3_9ARAC|nr:hypothetical protein CDAR_15521 [Caerostris darwini]
MEQKIPLSFLHVRPHSKGRSLDDEDHNCLFTSVRYFHLPSSVVNQDSWLPKGVTCNRDTVNLLPKTKDKSCLKEDKKKLASRAQCGGFRRDVLNEKTAQKQQEKLRKKEWGFILLLVVLFSLLFNQSLKLV